MQVSLFQKRNFAGSQPPTGKKNNNKRLQELGHRSSQHCDIGVSETFIMTNKGAALKYEHICSRDLDSRLP